MIPVATVGPHIQAPARSAALQAAADRDVIVRARHAYYVYPLLMLVLFAGTGIFREHPTLSWGTVTAIALALLLRVFLNLRLIPLYAVDPAAWRIWFGVTVALLAGAAGNLYGCVLLFYGYDHWTFGLVMVWTTGAAAGSVLTFTPDIRLAYLHIASLYIPPVSIVLWQHHRKSLAFGLALLLYLFFLVTNVRRSHTAYWKELKDRESEALRLREIEDARRAAEAASEAKSRFLADVSHEIRTPMHGILGLADLLLAGPATPEQRRDLEMLRGSAQGMLAIVNDLLDLSKIEAGRLVLDRFPFDVHAVVNEVHAILEPQAKAKSLNFECRVGYGVPPAVYGDPVRLRQVLLNLGGNAVKFTDRGFVRIAVVLEGQERTSASIRFSVRDSGPGVPREKHKAIFESYQQADGSIARRFGGTGLGLAIASRIVLLMGGEIELESEPGSGSTFAFSCAFELADQAAASPAGDPLPAPSCGALRVLLAEDNPVNQLVAVRLLHSAGHTVRVVDSGTDAVDAMSQEAFDIVLMDNHMPGMGGEEAAREIRRRGCPTPIIAVTASAMVGDRERVLAAGMNGFVTKPFRPADLLEEMRRLCVAAPSGS